MITFFSSGTKMGWKRLCRMKIESMTEDYSFEEWVAKLDDNVVVIFEWSEWTLPVAAGPFSSFEDAATFLLQDAKRKGRFRVEVRDALTNDLIYTTYVSL